MSDKIHSIFLSHDFFNKPRNRKWIKEQGAVALIILQTLWLASSQERDCRIQKDDALYLPYPFELEPEKVKDILESAVAVGLLEEEGEFYFNSQIVEDQKQFQVKRENYRKGKQKRDQTLSESRQNPDKIQEQSSDNHIECEYEYESEDLKKEIVSPPAVQPPKGSIELGSGIFIDQISHPQAIKAYRDHGLSADDLKTGAVLIAGNYAKNKNRPQNVAIDIIQPWVIGEIKKLKSAGQPPGKAAPPQHNPNALTSAQAWKLVRSSPSIEALNEIVQRTARVVGLDKIKSTDPHEVGLAESKFLQIFSKIQGATN